MNTQQALAFVERHGIVLESARRAAMPSLAEAVAGEPLGGNWWGHPRARAIFAATRAVRAAPEVLTCRLVDGKVTFVHERLWPALARLAEHFPRDRIARLHEVHSARGTHRVDEVRFPDWLPVHVARIAGCISEAEARTDLATLLPGLAERA